MSKQTYKICFCFLRGFKLRVAETPEKIKSLFDRYSENGIMNVDHLHKFLLEVQGEDKATKEDAQAIIDSLKEFKHLNIFHRKGLHLEAFFRYLFGDTNPPLSPTLGVHHDMTAPLSHYFIYTGHNSYLTGNQLSSDCSDIPIIKALQKGVRGIELDIWPNSTNDDVDVLHGWTLTTPVELIKCLRSIKKHAFSTSLYPVVITLEDHLTQHLQKKVAEMVTQTFGDMLFTLGPECLKEFPSPESLKKKIIISTKPPKEYLETNIDKEKESESQKGKDSCDDENWIKEVQDLKVELEADKQNDPDEGEDHQDEEDLDAGDHKLHQNAEHECKRLIAIQAEKLKGELNDKIRVDPNKVRRISLREQVLKAVISHGMDIIRFTQQTFLRVYPKITRIDSSNYSPFIELTHGAQMVDFNTQNDSDAGEYNQDDEEIDVCDPHPCQLGEPDQYKRLIAMHAGKPKGGLKESLNVEPGGKIRRLSLSEQALENATKSHGTKLVSFTQNNILRVYPKGIRFNSSNYRPMTGWMHGAQMVAFNMQGHGRSLWLMHGMFRSNGGCGYVKKPDFLTEASPCNEIFDPQAKLPVRKTLKARIYMGDGWRLDFSKTHFDTYSPPDFYTRIGIAGVPADSKMKKTKTVEDDWTPVWDEEFTFPLRVPELALLRIEVHDYDLLEKDDFGGQTCLPISELRTGIRAVPLFNRKGEKFKFVKLLVRFEFV